MRSELLTVAPLLSIQGSMVNEVEYNAGAVSERGRKKTHMYSVLEGTDKSNKESTPLNRVFGAR